MNIKPAFRSILMLALIFAGNPLFSQDKSLINWISMEEAEERAAKLPKPTMIYFYTDWCRFCKEMEKTTFGNEQIAAYINQNFYCVRINGEGQDTITFQDTVYHNTGTGERSTHDFTKSLLGDRLNYPTTIFFNNQHQFRFVVPGLVDIVKFEPMLVYILENVFLTETYEPFEAAFLKTFRAEGEITERSKAETQTIDKVSHQRKTIISLNAEWCNSCRVMNHATFLDPAISAIVASYFDVASIHVAHPDTIYWYGQVYAPNPQGGVHPFVTDYASGQLLLPLMFLFDEEGELLTPLPRYQPPSSLIKVLIYFGENYYRSMTWNEFLQQN